jgi:hypothetical protein
VRLRPRPGCVSFGMRLSSRSATTVLAVWLCTACGIDDSNDVRGRGLAVAALTPAAQARVYEAAVRGAFDVDESLSMLLDSRVLPRVVGLAPDGRVPAAVASALTSNGVIRGSCEPPLHGAPGVPRCTAERPGYIVRFSPVFALGSDSVQVYAYFQNYDVPGIPPSQTLRFERAYQVVKRGDEWTAVREGRVPKELRTEPRGVPPGPNR